MVCSVNDTADGINGVLLAKYIGKLEFICKKTLSPLSGSNVELFDEEKKISGQGPFKTYQEINTFYSRILIDLTH
jgi:hypothetical protein